MEGVAVVVVEPSGVMEPRGVGVALTTSTVRPVKRESIRASPQRFIPDFFFFLSSDSDKKIQQSWGGADGNTELKVEQAAAVDATTEANEWTAEGANASEWDTPVQGPATDAAPAADGDKADGRPRKDKEPEEEDNTLTLDQYLAQQKEKESVVPKLEVVRQANEGADSNIWKDVVPLSKADGGDSYYVGKVSHFLNSLCQTWLNKFLQDQDCP